MFINLDKFAIEGSDSDWMNPLAGLDRQQAKSGSRFFRFLLDRILNLGLKTFWSGFWTRTPSRVPQTLTSTSSQNPK